MKKFHSLFLLYFSLLINLSAQNDPDKAVRQSLWKNAPEQFKTTDVPQQWKDESAVILATRIEYIADYADKKRKPGNQKTIEKLIFHTRVRLQDKNSVSEYSEMSFDNKKISLDIFGKASSFIVSGIKVVKPDKSEKEIDLSKAVKSDAGSASAFKIAIPDLQPGDIIDYFVYAKNERPDLPEFFGSLLLEEKYPVVVRSFIIKIPDLFTLHTKSFNNAPKFAETKVNNDLVYTLTDSLRQREKNLQWEFQHISAPEIRYRLSNDTHWRDPEDLSELIVKGFYFNVNDIGFVQDFVEANFSKEKDKTRLAKEIYYVLRNPVYQEAYFKIKQGNPLNAPLPPNEFFSLLNNLYETYEIDHDVILAPSRNTGNIENQVDLTSSEFFIRTNTSKSICLGRPGPFTIPGELHYLYEGMPVIFKSYGRASGMDVLPLPVSTADSNTTFSHYNLKFDGEDFSQINLNRSIVVKGHNKEEHQYLICTNYDYIKEYDKPEYQVYSSSLMRGIIKEYNKEKLKLEQRLVQDYHERDERIKKSLEEDMDVKITEYRNLKIGSLGMWDRAPLTEYTDEMTLENLTRKTGQNVILEIGKLIEMQTEIKDDARIRDRAIHMPYPRTFSYLIEFIIPDGYQIQGLEALNKSVENATGGFISTAEVKGNKLIVTTKKYYSGNSFPADSWGNMLQFMDAAVEFYKLKVLLKKV
jgi:hypothetical protein